MTLDPRLKDFRNFLFLVWDHLRLPDPTHIQYDIADFIQNGPKRRIVEAFRGVGKSWVTSAYVVHTLLLDPTKNILVVSASKQRADDFSTFTLRLIHEMPILQHLRPRETQRNSKIAFDVGPAPASHAPSVVSKGITSQITGSRADLIIADDVESSNNSATITLRDKLAETVKEFEAVLKPGGDIIYLGTPQTEQSIYNLLGERGYSIRIWPARYPDKKRRDTYGARLAPQIASGPDDMSPTEPTRFDEFGLKERELGYGRSGFDLQFMLDTTLSDIDRYPLKLSDLIVMSLNDEVAPEKPIWAADIRNAVTDAPCVGFNGDRYYRPMAVTGSWIPYTGSVMAIDPSGRGADETAYAVVKMLNGYLYVVEAGGLPGGYGEDTMRAIVEIAKKQKINFVLLESNFGDGMFQELLKPYLMKDYPCTIEEVRHNIQKEKRIIDTLEPVMNQHRLVVNERLIKEDYESTAARSSEKRLQYQLFYQMSRITRGRGSLAHDDRVDVLAMAVSYWTQQMAQDADKRMRIRKDEVLNRELEKFMESAIGRKGTGGDSWIQLNG